MNLLLKILAVMQFKDHTLKIQEDVHHIFVNTVDR